jgi:hypothetical protein
MRGFCKVVPQLETSWNKQRLARSFSAHMGYNNLRLARNILFSPYAFLLAGEVRAVGCVVWCCNCGIPATQANIFLRLCHNFAKVIDTLMFTKDRYTEKGGSDVLGNIDNQMVLQSCGRT